MCGNSDGINTVRLLVQFSLEDCYINNTLVFLRKYVSSNLFCMVQDHQFQQFPSCHLVGHVQEVGGVFVHERVRADH